MASNIETKIDRIAAAKEAISAAIAGKGVTVPDGTLIDGMAALIESIEAGGGGGDFDFSNLGDINFVKSGSFTPTSDSTTVIITDEDFLKIIPKFYMVYTESYLTVTDKYLPLALIQAQINDDTGFLLGVWTNGLASFTSILTSYFKPFKFNATNSVTIADAYSFSSSSNGVACKAAGSGFIARASTPRTGSSSYYAYFESGSIYKYIYMGVKN